MGGRPVPLACTATVETARRAGCLLLLHALLQCCFRRLIVLFVDILLLNCTFDFFFFRCFWKAVCVV